MVGVGYAAWLNERDAAKPTREELAVELREERARRMRLRQLGVPLDYAPWEPEFEGRPQVPAPPY
jgi:hypothetical protein